MPVCRYVYPQEGMHRLHNSIASINNDYLFTAGRLQEATRFHQSGLVGGIRERFFLWISASRAQQRQKLSNILTG